MEEVAIFRRFAAVMLFSGLTAFPAPALDEADRAAGRTVIVQQIEAFKRDDAEAAYALAAPSIQGMFPSRELFLDMVRQGYRAVYRPRTFDFGMHREAGDGFEQALRIQDGEGVDWDAIYSLERQGDGSWRISGCRIVKRPGDAV